MSSAEAVRINYELEIIGFDNIYCQYQQDLVDEVRSNEFRLGMKASMLRSEFVRNVYKVAARPSIKPIVEEILKEIEAQQ